MYIIRTTALLILVAGCRPDLSDLITWRQETDRASEAVATPPPILVPPPAAPIQSTEGLIPDLFAPSLCRTCSPTAHTPTDDPLSQLPLSQISYIGHIHRPGRLTAYLQADQTIWPAHTGQRIGQEGGIISRILPQQLHIRQNNRIHIIPLGRLPQAPATTTARAAAIENPIPANPNQ